MERGSAMEQGPERVPLRNAGSSCPLLGRALSLGTALPWGDGEHSSALLGCAGPGSAPWLGEAVSPDSQTGRRSGVLLPQKHRKSPHITSDLPRQVMFPGSPGCCPRMSTSLSAHFCQHTACWHSHRGLTMSPVPTPPTQHVLSEPHRCPCPQPCSRGHGALLLKAKKVLQPQGHFSFSTDST